MNLSNKTVGCFDLGLWVENCLRLVPDCKEVHYFAPNYSAFPEPYRQYIGSMDGMKISDDFFQDLYKDKYDFCFIPDTMCYGIVNYVRKNGVPVAGVGDAEEMEVDRWKARQYQLKADMPYQDSHQKIGVTALEEFINKNKGEWYVKVPNAYRGIEESFKVLDPRDAQGTINHFRYALGPYAEDIKFLIEELLDGPEPGMDFISRSGRLVLPTQVGYEEKGTGIIMRTYWREQDVPKAMMLIYGGLAPEFKRHNMNFFSSFETMMSRENGNGPGPIPFLLDNTQRLAGPGTSAIQCELMTNYPQVVAGLAYGEDIDPIIEDKYAAACCTHSEEAMQTFLNISFPKNIRKWFKFRMGCKKGNDYYAIPKFDSTGTVIGFGDSIEDSVGLVKERMKEIHGKRLDKGIDRLEKIIDNIKKGRECGINF